MNSIKQFFTKINKIDTFSPYFFLPFILMAYFIMSLFDFHRFELFNVTVNLWPAVILAAVCYYIGVFIVDKKGWTFPTLGLSSLSKLVVPAIVVLLLIGLVSYSWMMFGGSLGISDESARRNLDPKLNFLAQLLWFGVLLLLSYRLIREETMTWKKALVYGACYAGVMFLFLLMGYRTPLVIMLFTGLITFHYVVKRIKLTWFIGFLVVVAVSFSMFGFMRVVTEDASKDFNKRDQPDVELAEDQEKKVMSAEQKVNLTPKWMRAMNGEMVTGHIVLSKIMEYTEEHGYLKGEMHYGIFSTVLPGEQISPRMRVTEVVNSISVENQGKYITRPNRTTTPTFIGQLFLDGGYLLVAIGFLLYGMITSLVYNKVKYAGVKSYHSVAYAFVITLFTVSLHTGLLDLIFVLMLGFVILTSAIMKTDKRVKQI